MVEEKITKKSCLTKWINTNIEEMHDFIGILLWMGLNKKPRIADY